MNSPDRGRVTQLLQRVRAGEDGALDVLLPLVYDELRKLASGYLRGERPGHTLQATALVHEAYLRLAGVDVAFEDRVHFLALAARTMRRILVDHARSARRAKRGGGAARVTIENALLVAEQPSADIIELDAALDRLAAFDARKARVVELHFFGGLTYDEAALAIGVSPATIDRDLRFAKAWLYAELSGA